MSSISVIRGVICPLENHYQKELKWICSNPNCASKRLGCNKCITLLHRNCIEYMLHIDELFKRRFNHNTNWIQNKEIKDAVLTIEKYLHQGSNDVDDYNELDEGILGSGGSITSLQSQQEDLYEQLQLEFEENLNKEFDNILMHVKEKINEVKEAIKKNYIEYLKKEEINPKIFLTKVKETYDFDKVIKAYEKFIMGHINVKDINEQYNTIFINNPKQNEAELEKISTEMNDKILKNTSIEHSSFEDLKKNLNDALEPLKLYVPQKRTWGWDVNHKAKGIILSEKNAKALKTDSSMAYTAIVGEIKMKRGKYIWEINVNAGNNTHQWISFGIIDAALNMNFESFPYSSTYGLTTYGQLYQMTKSAYQISEYDNKTYRCELNLTKGTFEIMAEGNVICSVNNPQLKDKTFTPYAILYRQNNSVTLRVIETTASLMNN